MLARRPPALPANSHALMDGRSLLARLNKVATLASANGAALDVAGGFPQEEFGRLAAIGALLAPLPPCYGGLGAGSTPQGCSLLVSMLVSLGHASLPVGRLFEGHVNALALIARYGTAPQVRRAAAAAAQGHVFGVWNTETNAPLQLVDDKGRLRLDGGKTFASGAGLITRPLVTARTRDERLLMMLPIIPANELKPRSDLSGWTASGMRASATGSFDFSGLPVDPDDIIGGDADYHRQPAFSAGAWRFCAVQLGGMCRLLDEARAHLKRVGRDGDVHQLARLGQMAIATETARLWVRSAAEKAEADEATDESAAYVNLARCAVERCGLDLLELANRSIGLAGFLAPHPVERVSRDLATYLRQPGPDGALAAGARRVTGADTSMKDAWT